MCDVISLSLSSQVTFGTWTAFIWTSTTPSRGTGTNVSKTTWFSLKRSKKNCKKVHLKTFFSFSSVVCWSPPPSSDRRRHRNGGFSQYGGSHAHHRGGGHNGMVGDPLCDSPHTLVDSALRFMRDRSGWDGADFIVWTG